MADEQIMTPQEVWAHIDSQTDWTRENKLAVWGTYTGYLSTFPCPTDSDMAKRAETWRKALEGWGLKV